VTGPREIVSEVSLRCMHVYSFSRFILCLEPKSTESLHRLFAIAVIKREPLIATSTDSQTQHRQPPPGSWQRTALCICVQRLMWQRGRYASLSTGTRRAISLCLALRATRQLGHWHQQGCQRSNRGRLASALTYYRRAASSTCRARGTATRRGAAVNGRPVASNT
jgi:hypothetical protein